MNDPDEADLADDELRDERGRTREDAEADEADRKRKIAKERERERGEDA